MFLLLQFKGMGSFEIGIFFFQFPHFIFQFFNIPIVCSFQLSNNSFDLGIIGSFGALASSSTIQKHNFRITSTRILCISLIVWGIIAQFIVGDVNGSFPSAFKFDSLFHISIDNRFK